MKRRLAIVAIGILLISVFLGGTATKEIDQILTSEIEWTRTYGGDAYDGGKTVQQTSDGGYILGGSTKSYGVGRSDAWLLKTDAAGTLEWNQTFGGIDNDYCQFVQQTRDDGYIVLGFTEATDPSNKTLWLIKTDHTGKLQWNQNITGLPSLQASLRQTQDGGYILAGMTNQGGDYTDYWLGKLDSGGTLQWNRTLDRHGTGQLYDMIQTTDGGYIVIGTWWVPIQEGIVIPKSRVVKTNEEGRIEWDQIYGGSSIRAIIQTEDEEYILAGASSTGFGLVKLNTRGDIQWQQTFQFHKGLSAIANAVAQTNDGGYILAGKITVSRTPKYRFHAWVVKTDTTGNMVWNLPFEDVGNYTARSIQQTAEGGYILAGGTNYSGSDDVWLVKLRSNMILPEMDRFALLLGGTLAGLILSLTKAISSSKKTYCSNTKKR